MNGAKQIKLWTEIKQFIFIAIGAAIAAVGLELFLVPNNILDGGVIGLSIIAAKMTGMKLSLFIVLFNVPFLLIGFRKMGLRFVVHALFGILVLSGLTAYLHHFEAFTDDLFLATVIGAVILGTGVGLVIRNGGVLDGTEVVAIIVSQKKPVSVGQFIMAINVFIFILAALLVFSWETAMYSIITYFIAYKMIDIVNEGLEELKSVTIISDYHDQIAKAIREQLHRGMTFIDGEGAFSGDPKKIIFIILSRIELSTLREIVNDIDPKALIAIENVADVSGSNFGKKNH